MSAAAAAAAAEAESTTEDHAIAAINRLIAQGKITNVIEDPRNKFLRPENCGHPEAARASAPQPTSRQHTATASHVTPVRLWQCGGEQPAHRGRQQQSTGAPVAAPRCRWRTGSGNSSLPADTGWQLQAASATAHRPPGRQRAAAGPRGCQRIEGTGGNSHSIDRTSPQGTPPLC